MKKIFFGMAVFAACLTMTASFSPAAQARNWKPKATALAQNYAEIIDTSKQGEMTVLFWFPAPMFAGKPAIQAMLDKYVIIGAVQAKIGADGALTPQPVASLQVMGANGLVLTPIAKDDAPPNVKTFLSAFGSAMSRSLGVIGQGMQYFVFNADGVKACEKGSISVPLDGETYTYNTPIPGCPAP